LFESDGHVCGYCIVFGRLDAATAAGNQGFITLDDLTLIKSEDFNGLLELIRNAPDDAILA
jgi:hypothetical protein